MSTSTLRRLGMFGNVALFLLALLAIALVVCYFAYRPEFRARVDATKTRAYSLSEQTQHLLADLQGEWTIALILVEEHVDPATIRQVDEVLRRYEQATESIRVVRVDPTDPASLGEYESLLARLREVEADTLTAYEHRLRDGRGAFEQLIAFAREEGGQLQALTQRLPDGTAVPPNLQQCMGLLAILGQEGDQVLDAVDQSTRANDVQPIPDYEAARSILAEALSRSADELAAIGDVFLHFTNPGAADPAIARFTGSRADAFLAMSQQLAEAAEPLARLPVLELASIGRQLQGGEAALIIGPERTAVIPSAQLFPGVNQRELAEGNIAFDRRFRGEQIISAAIRSLLVPHMPMVVFVHMEPQTMLRPSAQRADLVGIASLLSASRFDVREWRIGSGERPVSAPGQPVVWVTVPPLRREGLEPTAVELTFVQATRELVDAGEAVMVNIYPSLLPRYQLEDPWQDMLAPFGLTARTGEVVFEHLPGEDFVLQQDQMIDAFTGAHAICGALHGRSTYFTLPVPLRYDEGRLPGGVEVERIATIQPGRARWVETDWLPRINGTSTDAPSTTLEIPVPIVVAASRPGLETRQRVMLSGSGGWMLTRVADAVGPVQGGNAALLYPGNAELMLSSVAWLADMDELIAPSPVSQHVQRLEGIDRAASLTWGLITIIILPVLCLALGILTWIIRRV